ncbi:MAG: hypothetical protein RLY47_632, partial [Candidatus Parcubacteria bacterium]
MFTPKPVEGFYGNRKGPGRNAPGPWTSRTDLLASCSAGDDPGAVGLLVESRSALVEERVHPVHLATGLGVAMCQDGRREGRLRVHRVVDRHQDVRATIGVDHQSAPEGRRALLVVGELRRVFRPHGLQRGVVLEDDVLI